FVGELAAPSTYVAVRVERPSHEARAEQGLRLGMPRRSPLRFRTFLDALRIAARAREYLWRDIDRSGRSDAILATREVGTVHHRGLGGAEWLCPSDSSGSATWAIQWPGTS